MLNQELKLLIATSTSTRSEDCGIKDSERISSNPGWYPQGYSPVMGSGRQVQGAPDGFVWPNSSSSKARTVEGATSGVAIASIPATNTANRNFLINQISLIGVEYAVLGAIKAAEAGYMARRMDVVEWLGKLLTDSVLPACAGIGSYYIGLAKQRLGKGNLNEAAVYCEQAVRLAPSDYQYRALLALASIAEYQRDIKTHIQLLNKVKDCKDPYTFLESRRALALNLSNSDRHEDAYALLSSFMPVARQHKGLVLHWANSLAVESLALNETRAAQYYSSIALASPYASAYPEVAETAREVYEATRPAEGISVHIHKPGDLLPFMDKAKAHRDECERRQHIADINHMLDGFNLAQTIEVKRSCRIIEKFRESDEVTPSGAKGRG